jgi:hypothetical protein
MKARAAEHGISIGAVLDHLIEEAEAVYDLNKK